MVAPTDQWPRNLVAREAEIVMFNRLTWRFRGRSMGELLDKTPGRRNQVMWTARDRVICRQFLAQGRLSHCDVDIMPLKDLGKFLDILSVDDGGLTQEEWRAIRDKLRSSLHNTLRSNTSDDDDTLTAFYDPETGQHTLEWPDALRDDWIRPFGPVSAAPPPPLPAIEFPGQDQQDDQLQGQQEVHRQQTQQQGKRAPDRQEQEEREIRGSDGSDGSPAPRLPDANRPHVPSASPAPVTPPPSPPPPPPPRGRQPGQTPSGRLRQRLDDLTVKRDVLDTVLQQGTLLCTELNRVALQVSAAAADDLRLAVLAWVHSTSPLLTWPDGPVATFPIPRQLRDAARMPVGVLPSLKSLDELRSLYLGLRLEMRCMAEDAFAQIRLAGRDARVADMASLLDWVDWM